MINRKQFLKGLFAVVIGTKTGDFFVPQKQVLPKRKNGKVLEQFGKYLLLIDSSSPDILECRDYLYSRLLKIKKYFEIDKIYNLEYVYKKPHPTSFDPLALESTYGFKFEAYVCPKKLKKYEKLVEANISA